MPLLPLSGAHYELSNDDVAVIYHNKFELLSLVYAFLAVG